MRLESNVENDVIEDHCLISIPFKSASNHRIDRREADASACENAKSCAACSSYVASRFRNDDGERWGKRVKGSLTGELSS